VVSTFGADRRWYTSGRYPTRGADVYIGIGTLILIIILLIILL
jgi:hypothetical protein